MPPGAPVRHSPGPDCPLSFRNQFGFLDAKEFFTKHLTEFGKSENRLRLTGLKIVSDGSPQGKTAFFSKPYLTEVPGCAHDCKGFPNLTQAQLGGLMKQCYQAGIQLFTHANGDGAIKKEEWLVLVSAIKIMAKVKEILTENTEK